MTLNGAEERIVSEIAKWDGVVAGSHRFGGTEFRLGQRELGHIHGNHQADIPFPMSVRNQLIAEVKVEPHHIMPTSGWITFRFKNEGDPERAIDLFKLSYDIAIRRTGKASSGAPQRSSAKSDLNSVSPATVT
jgi:hypothetical protein